MSVLERNRDLEKSNVTEYRNVTENAVDIKGIMGLEKESENYADVIDSLLNKVLSDVNKITGEESAEKKNEWEENLKLASEKITLAYHEYEQNSEYENAFQLSRRVNIFAKKIKKIAMRHQDHYLYMMGFFNGTYSAFRNTLSHQNENAVFTVAMSQLIVRKHVKEILEYLYDNENTQNKRLCSVLNLRPNLLCKKLDPLIRAGCVVRYSAGKYAFYSLSDQGKRYVKNILGYKKKTVIDTEYSYSSRYKFPLYRSRINDYKDPVYAEPPAVKSVLIKSENYLSDYEDRREADYAEIN